MEGDDLFPMSVGCEGEIGSSEPNDLTNEDVMNLSGANCNILVLYRNTWLIISEVEFNNTTSVLKRCTISCYDVLMPFLEKCLWYINIKSINCEWRTKHPKH